MNFKIIGAIICFSFFSLFPFFANAVIMISPSFDLNITVNAPGKDDSFSFHIIRNNAAYTPPFDFSVQTSSGTGTYADLQDRRLTVGNNTYNLTGQLYDDWKFESASCQASNSEEIDSYPILNGIAIKIPNPPGNSNVAVSCVFNYASTAKTPVLFVPGLLGTEIEKDGNLLWVDPLKMINPIDSDSFLNPLAFDDNLKQSDNDAIYTDVIGKKIFQLGNNRIELYDYTNGLIGEFENQGYVTGEGVVGQNFFTFPYDWRYGVSGKYPDNKTNSDLLKEKIDQLAANSPTGKVDVIAHSMGGLIVKKYAMDNADSKIGKLVYVGVPNLGSPEAAKTLLMGNDFKILGLNSQEIYKISQNMPAAYDLLPGQAYFSSKGDYVNNLNVFPFGSKLDYSATDFAFQTNGFERKGVE